MARKARRWIGIHRMGTALLGGMVVLSNRAGATPPPIIPPTAQGESATTQPSGMTNPGVTNSTNAADFLGSLSRSNYLLGDMGGLRPQLAKFGISLNISETSEGLGVVSGGAKRGFDYDGLTQMDLQLDTQRAFGFYGGTFNISGLQLHGRNLSADYLDTLQTASGIEGDRSTRLWELWYQQKFLDEDRLDIKIGQQSLDQEFMVSQNALLFVNTMFGWPMVPSADLPGGGPAYPLSAPGVRARWRPTDSVTILAGVFNGSPVNNPTGDPQERNLSGTTFPLDGGALAIAEVQYAYPSLGTMVYADDAQPLSGTYRFGAWYDTESFADERFANVSHHGDFGIYAVVDQMLWHSDVDPDHALSVFCRAMGTPQVDRNLIDFSLNVGFTLHDPIPQRDDDTLGIGMGFAHVSKDASNADRDTAAMTPGYSPIRSSETFIELTYQYQLTPWCQIQPDFQYVFNPGAGVPNPNAPSQRIRNAAVLGVRFNILF
jgi:porin